ncbi:MAG TPA: hypothetical protein VMR49_04020 [Candidatus Paceibacterota bacterium]|jgi:hypothetical protein|nr:hypothetical protein [Candidatus Paceibacterota bacterium]
MKEIRNIDLNAMVLEIKPWPRSPRLFKAILGLNFQEIKSVQKIREIYNKYENEEFPRGKKSVAPIQKESAYYRWLDLSQEEIDKANDMPSAQKAWEGAPIGSYVKENGLIKMLEFSNKKQTKGIYFGAREGSLAKRKALEKLTTFFEIN